MVVTIVTSENRGNLKYRPVILLYCVGHKADTGN